MTAFDLKAFQKKKAGVLGLGKSGLACAKLLAAKGFDVLASDTRPAKELREKLPRLPAKVSWEGGRHSDRLLKCAFVVKSPGLAPSLPIFAKLKAAGVPVYSELEVGLALSKAREVVAVTGTNGKTTTTQLAYELFKKALPRGRKAHVCGNVGSPVTEVAPKAASRDVIVVEASSYQLEDSRSFQPASAALLNVTADHLDHHGGMEAYIAAKARVFEDQGPDDACVFNADDPIAMKLSRRCPSKRLYFGAKGPHIHAWVEAGKLRVRLPGSKKELAFVPPDLPGEHNLQNAMAAVLLALSRGLKPAPIQAALRAFKGVEHRIEDVGTIGGLRCVNDSKATNVDSTMVALKALESPQTQDKILLILGGLHKGSPYTPLRPLVERSVKGILTIGSAARKIEEDLGGLKPIFPCSDLATAVDTAFRVASKGDILLLSPACASFDQFQDFEDRGRRFKELVGSRR